MKHPTTIRIEPADRKVLDRARGEQSLSAYMVAAALARSKQKTCVACKGSGFTECIGRRR